MKTKFNNDEKLIVLKYFENLVKIDELGNEIFSNYPDIVIKNDNGKAIEIVNDFYIDNNEYETFKNNTNEYLSNNYKKLLFINDNPDCKYQANIGIKDTSKDNYVKNGSLVFKVNKKIDFEKDLEFKKYIESIENRISSMVDIPVRILFLIVF